MAYFRCMASGTGTGATITVSYESEVYGQTLTCTDGTHTYTKTAASTGSTVFTVPNGGTWTISVVMYGHTYSQQVIVVSDYTCTLALWSATVNISTTATELYSQTITVKKGGSTIGSTAFDSSGSATYIAPEEGTYTFECTYSGQTYSASVNVTEETTYSVVIGIGLELSQWLTAGGLDPSDYADLSEVLADEKAVRRLMTIHDSVDYLATASADDEMMETIIADDTCAKWINLRDYAFDVLSENSDIKSMMDTVDKYGYGEWVITDNTTTPPTWGAKGNVPIMTSNTAPYGEASASTNNGGSMLPYNAFDGIIGVGSSNFWHSLAGISAPQWIQYKFVNPICVKKISFSFPTNVFGSDLKDWTYKIMASNDGTNFTELGEFSGVASSTYKVYEQEISNDSFYLYYRYVFTSLNYTGNDRCFIDQLQFYGREMKVSVPTMTSNTQPWGEASASGSYSSEYCAYYLAFKGADTSPSSPYNSWAGAPSNPGNGDWIEFDFKTKKCIRFVKATFDFSTQQPGQWQADAEYVVEGSNDGSTWEAVSDSIFAPTLPGFTSLFDNDKTYIKYRLKSIKTNWKYSGNRYSQWGMVQFFGFDYSERDWDTEHPMRYLYDHGVELEEMEAVTTYGTCEKRASSLFIKSGTSVGQGASFTTSSMIDTSDYALYRNCSEKEVAISDSTPSNSLNFGLASTKERTQQSDKLAEKQYYGNMGDLPYNNNLDISSVNQACYVYFATGGGANGKLEITEWWLE